MSAEQSTTAVLDEMAAHARGDDLARLVHTVAFAAADERRTNLSDGLTELADRAGIARADAETRFGNVLHALEQGTAEAAGSPSRLLLGGLLARGVALSPPVGTEAESRVAEALVWLAANTSLDALPALDAALGDKAGGLWIALADLVRRVDAGNAPLVGRAGGLIAAAALRDSQDPAAREEVKALGADARDPIVRSLLAGAKASPETGTVSASGELVAPPRGPLALALLGFTGVLAVLSVARFVGRLALRYRRPAEVLVSSSGVVVRSRTELLGRTVRERETVIPVDALLKASREVKYPRVAMYTGLATLALGSYFGISLFIDGARAGSPELVGIGLFIVVLGVVLDFVLENVATTVAGRCRVVLVPRKGAALAIGHVEPSRADAALRRLLPG